MGQDALNQIAVLMAAGAALLGTSCQPRQLTVDEAVRDIHALNGKTITVAGYLDECSGYDCVLFTDAVHAQRTKDWFRRLDLAGQRQEEFTDKSDPFAKAMGIGSGELVCPSSDKSRCYGKFDDQAASFRHNYVLITGKVTDHCRDGQGRPGCSDRSTDLEPISIRKWHRPEEAMQDD